MGDSEDQILASHVPQYLEEWLIDSEGDVKETTLANRRNFSDKLLWFLKEHDIEALDRKCVLAFRAYLYNGHQSDEGRWGNAQQKKAARPSTAYSYYALLRTFCNWLVESGYFDASPIPKGKAPKVPKDQIQPFTQEQVHALLKAAKGSKHPTRDRAILLFLLDTGGRASEICNIRLKEVDFHNRRVTVMGKGGKSRILCLSRETIKALWAYLKEAPHEDHEPLFISDRGKLAGQPFTRYGLYQLIVRLGKSAGIEACRCSPHTFRHTFAIEFLRNGGDVFTLQQMLGHSRLEMTMRYVAIAQADIQRQHREHSPVDRLLKSR